MRLILILVFVSNSLGITYGASSIDSIGPFRYQFGVTPTALMNIYTAVQCHHKFYFKDRNSIQLETGLIYFHWDNRNVNEHGFRLRPSLNLAVAKGSENHLDLMAFVNYRFARMYRKFEETKANGAYKEVVWARKTVNFIGPGLGLVYNIYGDETRYSIGFGAGVGQIYNDYSPPQYVFGDIFSFDGASEELGIWFFHFGIGF